MRSIPLSSQQRKNELIERLKVDNLEHTTAMSSSGLGVLIQAYKSVKQKKGRMGGIHVAQHIKNLLIVIRLTSLFEHFDTETEAVAALNDGQT